MNCTSCKRRESSFHLLRTLVRGELRGREQRSQGVRLVHGAAARPDAGLRPHPAGAPQQNRPRAGDIHRPRARRHPPRENGRNRRDALDGRDLLPRGQERGRNGPVRGTHLQRMVQAHHLLHARHRHAHRPLRRLRRRTLPPAARPRRHLPRRLQKKNPVCPSEQPDIRKILYSCYRCVRAFAGDHVHRWIEWRKNHQVSAIWHHWHNPARLQRSMRRRNHSVKDESGSARQKGGKKPGLTKSGKSGITTNKGCNLF